MVKDAEVNAEEDKKVKELAESRNQADALVHSTRKSLTEYGDKLEAGEKEKIEAAITDLEGSIKSGDKAEIDAKVAALSTASQKLGEKMYADMQAQQAAVAARLGAAAGRRCRRQAGTTTWSTPTSRKSKTQVMSRGGAHGGPVRANDRPSRSQMVPGSVFLHNSFQDRQQGADKWQSVIFTRSSGSPRMLRKKRSRSLIASSR
jgi:uncharacterized protein with von Willebrand factor type A (vWA) domain